VQDVINKHCADFFENVQSSSHSWMVQRLDMELVSVRHLQSALMRLAMCRDEGAKNFKESNN
jgi:hypothetical protein